MSTDTVKVGRGLEISLEGLLALFEDRFPEVVGWQTMEATPHVDYSMQTQVFGFYWAWREPWEAQPHDEGATVNTVLRIGEGAPIPTARLALDNVRTGEGKARCGHMEPDDRRQYIQCDLTLGHKGEHLYLLPASVRSSR